MEFIFKHFKCFFLIFIPDFSDTKNILNTSRKYYMYVFIYLFLIR